MQMNDFFRAWILRGFPRMGLVWFSAYGPCADFRATKSVSLSLYLEAGMGEAHNKQVRSGPATRGPMC
jgi:hypothetical protein